MKGRDQTFCVIVTTYNRADYLPRTLNSLLAQTYERWVCWVIDDGSKDDTADVVRQFCAADSRFHYVSMPENRGGVAANELGMTIACEEAPWWTRLGSDDYFLPHKLELDASVIETHPAIFGPFAIVPSHGNTPMGSLPGTRSQSRKQLQLPGGFTASWANVASQTGVLKAVKERFGNFVNPSLRNMEDLQFNFRVSTLVDWVWRGRIDGTLVVDPPAHLCQPLRSSEIEHDAVWTVNAVGATANTAMTLRDAHLSLGLIATERDRLLWPDYPLPADLHESDSARSRALRFMKTALLRFLAVAPKSPEPLCSEVDARRIIGASVDPGYDVGIHGDLLGRLWELGQPCRDLSGDVAIFGTRRSVDLLASMFPHKVVHTFSALVQGTISGERPSNVVEHSGNQEQLQRVLEPYPLFSLVHIDTASLSTTLRSLELMAPRVVPGALIFLDRYAETSQMRHLVDSFFESQRGWSLCRSTPHQALATFHG